VFADFWRPDSGHRVRRAGGKIDQYRKCLFAKQSRTGEKPRPTVKPYAKG
jgi:hypothetical protein